MREFPICHCGTQSILAMSGCTVRPLVCGPTGALASLVVFGDATVLLNCGYDARGALAPAIAARARRRMAAAADAAVDAVLITHAEACLGLPELLRGLAEGGAGRGWPRVYATVATARAGLAMLRAAAEGGRDGDGGTHIPVGGGAEAAMDAIAAGVTGVAYGEAVVIRGRVRAVAVASGFEPGGASWVLLSEYSKVPRAASGLDMLFACGPACHAGRSYGARVGPQVAVPAAAAA